MEKVHLGAAPLRVFLASVGRAQKVRKPKTLNIQKAESKRGNSPKLVKVTSVFILFLLCHMAAQHTYIKIITVINA